MKRAGSDGNWADVENVRRYDGAAWQDVEFVRRWNGTSWVDCWTPLYFRLGGTGNLGSLGHVLPLEGGGAEMALQYASSDGISTYSAEICLNQYQTFSASSTLELDWKRVSNTGLTGSASIFGIDSESNMIMVGSNTSQNFSRTTTQYSFPAGFYRLYVTFQMAGGSTAGGKSTLTIYGIKIDAKDIPIEL